MQTPQPLRIALVAPYDLAVPGGVLEHIVNLDRQLRAMGHKVWVLGPTTGEPFHRASNVIPISHTVLPFPMGGSIARVDLSPGTAVRIRALAERHAFDIVHVHEPLTPILPWAMLRYSQSTNIGTFHASREGKNRPYSRGRRLLEPIFARLHGLIAVSVAAREMVAPHFPGDYHIVPNGVDVARFGPGTEPASIDGAGHPCVLFVGRLEKRKGFGHLADAFALVRRAEPDARLVVVGAYEPDDAAPFVAQLERAGVHDAVFVGRVSDADLPRYYRAASVVCAPSTGFESFGIVLLEAMAAGVPVVASDIVGYRAVLDDGVQGVLVPPADPDALAAAIVALLRDPAARRRLGEAGVERARSYDWPIVARRVVEVYDAVRARAVA